MVKREEESSAQVSWDDQQRINRFSTLNLKADSLRDLLAAKRTEKEYGVDLAAELELSEEPQKFRIGETFFTLPVEACLERIESNATLLDAEIRSLEQRLDAMETEMKEIKGKLNAKFGNAINLEK